MAFKKFGDSKKIKVVNPEQPESDVKKCPICGEMYINEDEHEKKCKK